MDPTGRATAVGFIDFKVLILEDDVWKDLVEPGCSGILVNSSLNELVTVVAVLVVVEVLIFSAGLVEA